MNLDLNTVKAAAVFKGARLGLKIQKFSPEILTTVGVVGLGVSAVMLVRSTLKAVPVIEKLKEDKLLLEGSLGNEIDKDTYNKGITQAYTRAGIDLGKMYLTPVTMGLASVACLLGAQKILSKRNVAMAAAYKTLEESFVKYRERVTEELGADQERDIYKDVEETEVVEEDGSKSIVKTSKSVSGYARFFDEWNNNWSKQPEYNLTWLLAQQSYANELLKARGHLFLNEVYESLGLPHTEAGAIVGWFYDLKNPDVDNYVDFGIMNGETQESRDFVNGFERSIRLDFNVDGPVWNLLNKN